MSNSFQREWSRKVKQVRASSFWQQVSSPPPGKIFRANRPPKRTECALDNNWALIAQGSLAPDGPARTGLDDLKTIMKSHFGLRLRAQLTTPDSPHILFQLTPPRPGQTVTRWDTAFRLDVSPTRIIVRAPSENALLQASLYLSNYCRLQTNPYLPLGRRTIKPNVQLHLACDLWGGFCTTQAWVHGREHDRNFIEMARVGVNCLPIMILLEDYLTEAPKPFRSLINPQAQAHRRRLAQLARSAAAQGVHVFLLAYNPKPKPDHPVFKHHPRAAGTMVHPSAFRVLCSSDQTTRQFLVDAWASLFHEIPELGGMLNLVGGEGFWHCLMAQPAERQKTCPRCSQRPGSQVVAQLINHLARGVHKKSPEARVLTWTYSATHWSHDRDHVDFINLLDPDHVIYQTEFDKDSVDWRPAGYGKHCWDYSAGRITPSPRSQHQRALCRPRNLPFSYKLQINNSIECLSVPYFPILYNQLSFWKNCRAAKPHAIHSRWLFDGANKSPAEELGYWSIWGDQSPYRDLEHTLRALAQRDFGPAAARHVLRAWKTFSQAMCHHPCLDYGIGPYFIGPAQPLVLNPDPLDNRDSIAPSWEFTHARLRSPARTLDPAFFGVFYWLWEKSATDDDTELVTKHPLFYYRPGFHALARRGPNTGQDVALQELQTMAQLWEKGIQQLRRAQPLLPPSCRPRFKNELILAQHLAYTWRSGANVEEFLRLRDTVLQFSCGYDLRAGHLRENLRDLDRMTEIAQQEIKIARQELTLVKGVEFLDLSLRLDMSTASLEEILRAKIAQVQTLLRQDLPAWRQQLQTW